MGRKYYGSSSFSLSFEAIVVWLNLKKQRKSLYHNKNKKNSSFAASSWCRNFFNLLNRNMKVLIRKIEILKWRYWPRRSKLQVERTESCHIFFRTFYNVLYEEKNSRIYFGGLFYDNLRDWGTIL